MIPAAAPICVRMVGMGFSDLYTTRINDGDEKGRARATPKAPKLVASVCCDSADFPSGQELRSKLGRSESLQDSTRSHLFDVGAREAYVALRRRRPIVFTSASLLLQSAHSAPSATSSLANSPQSRKSTFYDRKL